MLICGVEIKGSEAIFALIDLTNNEFKHRPTETKKITLADDDLAANVRSFSELVAGFLRDNKINDVVIKKRGKKGEFAGGPTTFKIEGIFQMIKDCKIELIAAPTIAAQHRKHNITIPDTLNKYQMEAFRTGCAALMQRKQKA